MKNDNSFSYTYSAEQQTEIEKIREKYAPTDCSDDKTEQLRRLDKNAEKPGTIASITLGILSVALFGVGMCCTMVWADKYFALGIIIGVIGLLGMICSKPLYNLITEKKREQIAPEILKLTDELTKK